MREVRALARRCGLDADELDVARLVLCDPRRRIVICASGLIGSVETVVGFGAIEVGAAEPDLLIVDTEQTEGLGELMTAALRSRSASIAERPAAA